MDELIHIYVSETFHEEQAQDVNACFNLFDFFEHPEAYLPLIDLLADSDRYDPQTVRDSFTQKLHEGINFIFDAHGLGISSDATLHEKVQIAKFLGHIQNLADYTPVAIALESLEDDEVQIAKLIEDFSMITFERALELIASVKRNFIPSLKKFIYSKEKNVLDVDTLSPKIINKLKIQKQLTGKSLFLELINDGLKPGQPLSVYAHIMDLSELATEDDNLTANNILSLLYTSSDGFNSALLTYRKHSLELLGELSKASRIENIILKLISDITNFEKEQDEKSRVS